MPWTQPTTGWQSPVRCLIFLLSAVPLWAQLTITTFSLSPASVNVPYMQTLAATGGTGLLVWSTVSPLPTGVLLTPVGILAGIPTTQIGSPFSITARVQDSALPNPNSVTRQLSLIVNQPIITTSSPLSVASLNTGYIDGVPTSNIISPYNFAALATDGVTQFTKNLTLVVNPPVISNATLPP